MKLSTVLTLSLSFYALAYAELGLTKEEYTQKFGTHSVENLQSNTVVWDIPMSEGLRLLVTFDEQDRSIYEILSHKDWPLDEASFVENVEQITQLGIDQFWEIEENNQRKVRELDIVKYLYSDYDSYTEDARFHDHTSGPKFIFAGKDEEVGLFEIVIQDTLNRVILRYSYGSVNMAMLYGEQ